MDQGGPGRPQIAPGGPDWLCRGPHDFCSGWSLPESTPGRMSLPPELEDCVGSLEKAIGGLESTLSELIEHPLEDVCRSEDPQAVARLQVSLAYALNASFFS